MSILRLWVIGSVLAAILILALGWFLGIQPRLDEAGAAELERRNVAETNAGYEATLIELRELSANLPALERDLDAIRVEIPDAPELSTLLGQLNEIAVAAGVSINEVTANTPQLVEPELLEPLGVTDLVAIPVQISALGSTEGLSTFLRNAQFGPRLLFVSSFTTSDDAETGRVSLTGFIFVLPEEGAVLPSVEAGAVEGADPAGTPTPTPTP